jgi:hypothetical protein
MRENALVPMLLIAATLKKYEVPATKPVTVKEESV